MYLCACVIEERNNGEGVGSEAISLLSDSIFWEYQNVTIQLNTVRSNASDIQNAQNHTCTTPTYTRADRRIKCESYLVIQRIAHSDHQADDVSMYRRISPALPAIRVAFAPDGVPVVNSHVRLLHLHFLHFWKIRTSESRIYKKR
jgi:hypothetical protein